jgi:hypothetical protein
MKYPNKRTLLKWLEACFVDKAPVYSLHLIVDDPDDEYSPILVVLSSPDEIAQALFDASLVYSICLIERHTASTSSVGVFLHPQPNGSTNIDADVIQAIVDAFEG